MKKTLCFALAMAMAIPCSMAKIKKTRDFQILPFADNGSLKMLYDNRQRPQAIYLEGKLYIVFNGGAFLRKKENSRKKAVSKAMAVTYDLRTGKVSKIVTIGRKYSSDHHDGPVIWADNNKRLHVFYGWHHDLGTHLISKKPLDIGSSFDDWSDAPPPAPEMSYPWTSRIYDRKQLVFYRTAGHYSSWTYRISSDNGRTWGGPKNDVIDLDIRGGMTTDWSCYTAKAISRDGNFLHVAFIAYDDFKRPRSPEELASGKLDRSRLYNPLYNNRIPSNYKYNLYYIKINLRTHEVMNDKGEVLQTPLDLKTANSKCMIWNTKWRGGGIVPYILADENGQVSFLHNISDIRHEKSLSYHYVRLADGKWKHTRITSSNHHWNSSCLSRSEGGVLHAYLITGEGYLESGGYMDRYGGGTRIEEWISADNGNTWEKKRDLTPDPAAYAGWKYNNIRPVKKPDGTPVDGMFLFYGWKDKDAPKAKAFLLIDRTGK